jgi:hypothetical protein
MPVSACPDVYWLPTVSVACAGTELPCVNTADALVPSEALVAVTVLAPEGDDCGTTNEAVKAPAALEVTAEGVVETAAPPYVRVIAVPAGKLLPVTVTCVPAAPAVGLRVIAAVLYTAVSVVACDIETVLDGLVEPLSSQWSKTMEP